MAQPIESTEYDPNGVRLSMWGVDGNGVLAEGEYKKGSVLGKNGDGNFELTEDATKAEAILLEDTVVPAGKTQDAPIVEGGEVAEDALVFGGALTVDDVREPLRKLNIYIKKRG